MEDCLDPYRVLGLQVGADEATIQRRYRELVRKHHPDVAADSVKAHQRFVRIQQAYRMLMDPAERARWETTGGVGVAEPGPTTFEVPRARLRELLEEGRRLLGARRLREARDVVAAAIELNPFSPDAYRLLGDIYASGGNIGMASEMYREAELLRGEPAQGAPSSRNEAPAPPQERPALRPGVLVLGGLGAAVCLLAMALAGLESNAPRFAALGMAAAFLLVAAAAASGVLEPIDAMLGLEEVRQPGRGAAPGAIYLVIVSLLSPYLGLLYYAIVSALTESLCPAVLKVYVVVFGVAVAAWLAAGRHDPGIFALIAPSLGFAGALGGWLAGSVLAPGEWWRR